MLAPMTDDARRTAMLNGYRVTPDYFERFMASQHEPFYRIGGEDWPRVRYGAEQDPEVDAALLCHDCRAAAGQYHAVGCDMEECPCCGEQAIMCDCDEDEES